MDRLSRGTTVIKPSFLNPERGSVVLTLMISLMACMTIFYFSIKAISPYNYFQHERFKEDVQSFVVQTKFILGQKSTCEQIFKNKTLSEVQASIDSNSLTSTEKFTFGQPGVYNKVYAKKVRITRNSSPIFSGGKGYYGQISFAMDYLKKMPIKDQVLPFYFVLDPVGKVETCHATILDKNNVTLEDRICSLSGYVQSKYNPETDACKD